MPGSKPEPARLRAADDHVPRAHRERAAVRHGLTGVDGEVDDRLLELPGVRRDRGERAVELDDQLDVLADEPAQHRFESGDDVVQIDDLGPQHLACG